MPTVERNIWEDEGAAEFVRSHARGYETVPTVEVAGQVLVNPPGSKVVALAEEAGMVLVAPEVAGPLRRLFGR